MDKKDIEYKELFQKSPLARMVVSVEREGRCIFRDVNEVAGEYFGLSVDEMIGQTSADLFEKAMADHLEQSYKTCIKAKRPVAIRALPKFPGGLRVQSFIFNPLLDDNGDVAFIDILARPDAIGDQQMQRERDDAILLLTSLFDASGLGIVVTDTNGTVVRVNDSFLEHFGWAREEMLGQNFTVIIPEESRAEAQRIHDAFIDHGRQGSREVEILRKDGHVADTMITTALLELSQRQRFMVATVMDITGQKEMEEHLRDAKDEADSANRAKSAFLANMSHELRTPLNAVIGFSELIKNQTFGAIDNEKYEEYITDIHFSARHLLEIINDVLDMSKIEAGKIELIESEICTLDVFQSVMRIMSDRAVQAGIKIKTDIDPQLPHMMADQRLVRQMLINLVSNAIKFSDADQEILIHAFSTDDGGVCLSVEDFGCGIPEDRIADVLEPFGQVSDPKKYRGQGTGLGVPLSKAMIELHGGALRIESVLGEGTTVYLTFPADRAIHIDDPSHHQIPAE